MYVDFKHNVPKTNKEQFLYWFDWYNIILGSLSCY